MLVVKNLSKRFGKTTVLKNINLVVNKKDRIAIIGSSGCGKSTLLRCINQIETPSNGKVLFRIEKRNKARGNENGNDK